MLQKKIRLPGKFKAYIKASKTNSSRSLWTYGIVMNQFLIWITSFVLVRKT